MSAVGDLSYGITGEYYLLKILVQMISVTLLQALTVIEGLMCVGKNGKCISPKKEIKHLPYNFPLVYS